MKDKREKRKNRMKALRQAVNMELKEHRSTFIVFSILRILVIVCMVRQIFLHNYESFFLSVLTLLLLYIPSWLQVKLRIEIPIGLEISILCFIFAAEILGEINAFYINPRMGHHSSYAERLFVCGCGFFPGLIIK